MSYSVGQVSAFAGVTVRTLHHYDRAGLLSPSGRSGAGYRLYSDADLEDFLAAGARPVFVGFGSRAGGHGERLSEIAVEALRRAGLRGILQAGS
ncbi:MerR family DNA-binding transcriptional regulator, partial [Streptomyces sp. T21Q-yed]